MVGGASLFLHLKPRRAVLADINAELINFYRVLKATPRPLISRLSELSPSKKLYYQLRSVTPVTAIDRAVRFAYLNRLCWNALYRVNRKGLFNVPFGGRRPKHMWDPSRLLAVAKLLRGATLRSADFQETAQEARKGDFVFLDPPYPKGSFNGNGFNRYHSEFFSFGDHERLASLANRLSAGGVLVMVTECTSSAILDMFDTSFNRHIVETQSLIASHPEHRRLANEAILTNY